MWMLRSVRTNLSLRHATIPYLVERSESNAFSSELDLLLKDSNITYLPLQGVLPNLPIIKCVSLLDGEHSAPSYVPCLQLQVASASR